MEQIEELPEEISRSERLREIKERQRQDGEDYMRKRFAKLKNVPLEFNATEITEQKIRQERIRPWQ